MAEGKRLLIIACEVLAREVDYAAARAPRPVDVLFLSQGLHEVEKPGMAREIQGRIDAADPELYEAIGLAYALCNNGVVDVRARSLPVAVPRAHDCIALLLGSHRRYMEEFERQPGTYYYSPGWLERDRTNLPRPQMPTVTDRLGTGRSYGDLAAEYGEEAARYVWDQLKGGLAHYTRAAYIAPPFPVPDSLPERARAGAAERGWEYERLAGDLSLLEKLVSGRWPAGEFLVLEPGQRLAAGDPGGDIMRAGGGG